MGVSFILSCRNDGYGGAVSGVENPTIKSLEIACKSIRNTDSDAEIIVVEWNPNIDKERVSDILFVKGIRIISVSEKLQKMLDDDWSNGSGIFYEYIAKDIGAKKASNDNLIFTNADDIFVSRLYEESIEQIEMGKLVRAVRFNIARNILTEGIDVVLEKALNQSFVSIGRSQSAAGDFIGIKKNLYLKIGGFIKKHGIWDIDGEFVVRARDSGIEMVYVYEHYHIEHERNHILGPWGRSSRSFQDINFEILDDVDEYCSEVVI